MVDVGTGDGRYVVRTAAADPSALVIGVDPNVAGLGAGYRDAHKRRLDNTLFVVASAEALPAELSGIADEVRVHFPWAGLLDAVVHPDPVVATNLASLLRPGGRLVLALSVIPRDGVADVACLDEPAVAAIGRRDRKSTRLNSSHVVTSRMPSSA